MHEIETKSRKKDSEPHQPHVRDRSPAGWEPLILESDAEAERQLGILNRNNEEYFEQNRLSEIQGVSNSLGGALDYVADEFAEIFRNNLRDSMESLLSMSDFIREQALEQGRTEFFVLAGMTGELVAYYRDIQTQLKEVGREGLERFTEAVYAPAFASNALTESEKQRFEFELVRLPENVDLMLHNDSAMFSGAMMHSHTLLINIYFTPDQKLRDPQEIDRILEYVDDALSIKSENYYWQGF